MSKPQQFEWAKNIPCRNIQIHGYCKWENKGCSFNHDMGKKTPQTPPSQNAQSAPLPEKSSTAPASARSAHFNFDTPAFTPSKFSESSASVDDISAFVPGKDDSADNITSPIGTLPSLEGSPGTPRTPSRFNPETAPVFTPVPGGVPTGPRGTIPAAGISPAPSALSAPSLPTAGTPGGPVLPAVDPFFQQTNLFPMNYHLYAPLPPPHVEMNKRPNERTVNDLFLSGNLREYLQQKNEASLRAIPNSQLNLPLHVGPYHSLYPVDKHFDKTDKSFGYLATIFKCVSNLDGRLYCMRRLEGVPITSGKFLEPIKKWKLVDSANVVKVYDAFTSKAFGDLSLITIYDYYPLSLNLMETHFYRIGNKDPELITEAILWSYIVQLTNAAMEIHNKGLFVGEFDPTKIIVTNKGRVRLSSCAIGDIVEASKDHNQFQNGNQKVEGETDEAKVIDEQKKDLERLGGLVLNLSKSTTFIKDSSTIKPMEIIDRLTFSDEFKKILRYCLTPDSTWEHFQELLAPHILEVANGFENSADYMESSLLTEVENARLVRLLCKLDVISERPEFIKDGSWSETGERYPIKLFKDYVFHQVDEAGNSVVDLTHIVNCLNKLDSGVDENVLLVSPDEMTCLVMSYKRLKELVESSFRSLS